MDRLELIILALDESLDTRRKRHVTGGILISVSLLFGGLAFTILSLRAEEYENE